VKKTEKENLGKGKKNDFRYSSSSRGKNKEICFWGKKPKRYNKTKTPEKDKKKKKGFGPTYP